MMRTKKIHRERIRRCIAMLLTICMVLQSGVNAVFAAVDSGDVADVVDEAEENQTEFIPGLVLPDGRCLHHTSHTEECGYQECSHVHTRECFEITWDCVMDEEEEDPSEEPSEPGEEASPSDAEPGGENPDTEDNPAQEASPSDADEAQGDDETRDTNDENGDQTEKPGEKDETEEAGKTEETGGSEETGKTDEIGKTDETGRTDDSSENIGTDKSDGDRETEETGLTSLSEEAEKSIEQDALMGSAVLQIVLKASPSNANASQTKTSAYKKASPSDAEADDEEEDNGQDSSEILDEADEDYEFDGEIDLINDVHVCSEEEGCVIEEIHLVCTHVHDEECGGADCTFECPYGCEKNFEDWLRSGIGKGELRTKEENLVAGEEYTYESLVEMAEVVSASPEGKEEVTVPVGINQVVRMMTGSDGTDESQIIWDGAVNEAEELRIVPEEPQENVEISYNVTYAYEDRNIDAAKSILAAEGVETDGIAMMSLNEETENLYQAVGTFGVASAAEEYDERYVITPKLEGTVFSGEGYEDPDILEGVTVKYDSVIEGPGAGNPVGVRIQSITREKPDATGMKYIPDDGYTWNGVDTVLHLNPARRKYVITYEAYDTVTGRALNAKTVWLMVAEAGDVAAVLERDEAYITRAGMADRIDGETKTESAIVTGSAPFDNNDDAGNDSSATNKVVRTYDIVSYKTMFYTGMHPNAEYPAGYKRGRLYFQYYLPVSKEQAQFEPDTMMWPDTKESCYYEIDEIKDGNGKVTGQVMRGSFILTPTDENPAAIGASYQELGVVIRVYKMHNGDTLQPRFTYWLEGNDVGGDKFFEDRTETWVNDDSDGDGKEYAVRIPSRELVDPTGTTKTTCHHHKGVQEYQTIVPDKVTVSAAPRFNIQVLEGSNEQNQLLGTFDFNTGKEGAANKGKGDVYGRLGAFGVNLQIVGKSPDLGLRGVELPDENTPIEFDLAVSSVFRVGETDHSNIPQPLFWSVDENLWKGGENSDGRRFSNKEGNVTTSDSAAGAGPHNKEQPGERSYNRCKNGGVWSYKKNEDGTLHVTVTGFEADLTHLPYACNGSSTTQYDYYDPEILGTGNVSGSNEIKKNYWNVQNAYFSSGEVWAVQPFMANGGTGGESIAQTHGNGSFTIILEAKNLKMKSKKGEVVTWETNIDDNKKTQGLSLLKPGGIDNTIYYQKFNGEWNDPLTPGAFYNGSDWAVTGQQIQLEEVIWNDAAEGMYTSVAYDQLIKFDDQFLEPENMWGNSSFAPGVTTGGTKRQLWGAKPDKTGWNHQGKMPDEDGYDEEMMEATADDLIFYKELKDLRADGYVPVAALVENRGVVTTGMNHLHMHVQGRVKASAKPGHVYMLTHNSVAWNKNDVADAVIKDMGLTCTREEVTNEQYNKWLTENFPTRETNHGANIKYPDQTPGTVWAPGTKYHGNSYGGTDKRDYPATAYWMATAQGEREREPADSNIGTYKKVRYVNNQYGDDPAAGDHWGDSCLVMSYKSAINTQVAQKSNNGSMKQKFDLSMNQRYADFVLYPSIVRETFTPSTGDDSKDLKIKTNVVIQAELPTEKAKTDEKGNIIYVDGKPVMEPYFPLNYISGSSCWGGVYNETKNEQGTITGGIQTEPVIEYKERGDGVLVPYKLTWTLNNVEFSAVDSTTLDPIYFTCEIGVAGNEDLDVKDGDSMAVTATIETTEDIRQKASANGNLSTVGISVLKDSSISLSQVADQIAVDQREPIGFTMNVGNNSVNDIANCYIVNGLPFNGDHSGSSFAGPVQVTEFSYGSEDALEEIHDNFQLYYTTNEKYRGVYSEYFKENPINLAEDKDWIKLEFREKAASDNSKSVNYVATNLPEPSNDEMEGGNIVAVVAYGTLPGGKTLKMHVTVNLPNGKQGDYVVNHLTRDQYMRAHAHSYIVSRQLEGLVWWDANQNGIQDYGENTLDDVAVALMKLKGGASAGSENLDDYEYYRTADGKNAVMLTGQQMNLITGEVKAYTAQSPVEGSGASEKVPGHYRFYNLKEGGTFAVVFLDKSCLAEANASNLKAIDLTEYIASPRNVGMLDNIDSDAIAVPNEGLLVKTFIPSITMPDKKQLSTKVFTSRYHDSGLYSRKARIRFAKWIDNLNNPDKNVLGFEPSRLADDEFIITVKEQGKGGMETGMTLKHAGSDLALNVHDEKKYSGYIEVLTSEKGTTYKIDEIVPKEYEKSGTFLTYAPGSFRKGGSLGKDTVTVMPEEVVVVVVHNTFEHKNYFHDEASAMNRFPAKAPSSGSRSVPAADMAAIVPEQSDEKVKQLDEERRLA